MNHPAPRDGVSNPLRMNELLAGGLHLLCARREAAALIEPRLETITALLRAYMDEIEKFNPAYGLVSVENREELATRHILDSLAPLGCISALLCAARGAPRVADAGSGAGLPGIPLAICLPGAEFTLIERMGRRAGFLRNAAAVLGLANVAVEETELEKAEGGRFDLVVFRALSPLGPLPVKKLFRLLAPGGAAAAYKGKRETAEREAAAVRGGLDCTADITALRAPFLDEQRCLVTLRPAGSTP